MSELVTLTKTEVQTLADLEAIVERGQLTFIEVGKALFRIKNEELFAQTHGSFTESVSYTHLTLPTILLV